jgi:hypothetical protein
VSWAETFEIAKVRKAIKTREKIRLAAKKFLVSFIYPPYQKTRNVISARSYTSLVKKLQEVFFL